MRVVIIEDESLAGKKIESLLSEIDSTIEVLTTLKSVEGALEWFNENPNPDLVISDIRLLDGISFEIFDQIDYSNPVIFTTAYDQYAIKAFDVNSVDYLLKPVQKEKLEKALGKIKNNQPANVPFDELIAAIQNQQKEYKSRFMIKTGQKILAVPVDKIAYFFSQNKLTYIVAQDGKKYPYDQTLEEVDQQVDPKLFFRANRKYITRFSAISEIHPYFKGRIKINLTPEADDEIVISSERTPEFKKWLDQ
ncbi:LytR/AlgR family response regulator transcription factor [Fulvivirga lutea]|uniref:Response regulator transcription factor n=1 Tax=Fulvivirga lutea TaxID=2810512 RepID=A0A974WDE5_9BACT|nr:LytTR family DNA-binding domain-containing protein [Fulvivirga lutea]QSE95969.1 response regulator transcription factor [Fulvivirga lutea]